MYSEKTLKNIENTLKNGFILNKENKDDKSQLINLIIQSTIMEFSIFTKEDVNITFDILQEDDLINIKLDEKEFLFGGGKNMEIGIISIPYDEFAISFKKKIGQILFDTYEFSEDAFWDRTESYIPQSAYCDQSHLNPRCELIDKEDFKISLSDYNDTFPLEDDCVGYTRALLNMYIDIFQTRNDSIFTRENMEDLLLKLDLKNYKFLSSMRKTADEFFKNEIKEKDVVVEHDIDIEK